MSDECAVAYSPREKEGTLLKMALKKMYPFTIITLDRQKLFGKVKRAIDG
jgi:hypothetical protein